MNYIILLLSIFVFVLLVKNFKNQYTWVFLLMSAGISISLFALIIYVSKIGNYRYPSNDFFMLDYKIYLVLSSLKISYYDIFRFLNIGIAIFLFSVPLIGYEYTKKYRIMRVGKRIAYFTALGLLPIFYIWFYDPETSFSFYILMMDGSKYSTQLVTILKAVDIINYLWILIYLFHPIFLLWRQFSNTKILIKKKQTVAFGTSLMALNAMFVGVFIFGPFKELFMLSNGMGLLKFSTIMQVPGYYYNVLPAIMLLALLFIIVLLFKMGVVDSMSFFTQRTINRNTRSLNENLRGSMHSFKNTLFSFKVLAEQAENEYGTEKGLETIKRIRQLSDLSIDSVTRMLNMLKEIRLKPAKFKLVDSIEAALLKCCCIPKDIVVKKDYLIYDAYAYFDFYHMTEAFANIIQNAVDALKNSDDKKIITICIHEEQDLIEINISDNGCGINKKVIKKIFNPFYSTKSGQNSWGVGLSFTYRVIKAHMGYITVESKENKYTTFKILLPNANGGYDIE